MSHLRAKYDGGDEEFWHTFYATYNELPLAYHGHVRLGLSTAGWRRVKMLHLVSTFGTPSNFPTELRPLLRHFA